MSNGVFITVIGDIVSSRKLRGDSRRLIQQRLAAKLAELNLVMQRALKAGFQFTLGDEFEGVLNPEFASALIPDLIWTVEEGLSDLDIRFGVGLGPIDTDFSPDPRNMDGPAFHSAREAIENAAKYKRMGGVFRGFGSDHDPVLNGMARLLHRQRLKWSGQQRLVAGLLRAGKRQTEVAEVLGISKQAVSSYARAAGWETYLEGESGWRKAIEASVRRRSTRKLKA